MVSVTGTGVSSGASVPPFTRSCARMLYAAMVRPLYPCACWQADRAPFCSSSSVADRTERATLPAASPVAAVMSSYGGSVMPMPLEVAGVGPS